VAFDLTRTFDLVEWEVKNNPRLSEAEKEFFLCPVGGIIAEWPFKLNNPGCSSIIIPTAFGTRIFARRTNGWERLEYICIPETSPLRKFPRFIRKRL
jgi:hypothetical protein